MYFLSRRRNEKKEDGTGGSNGACMRMAPEKDWGANAGLGTARDFVAGELLVQERFGLSRRFDFFLSVAFLLRSVLF